MKNWQEICGIKTFEIEGKKVPAVSLGTSPFLGAGQFGSRAGDYYRRFYQRPENIELIIRISARLGIPAVQVLLYDRIVRAVLRAQADIGVKLFTTVTIGIVDWKRELSESNLIDPTVCFIHARITDLMNKQFLTEIVDAIRREDMIPGCATHDPVVTIPFLEESGLPIGCYLAPLNRRGLFAGGSSGKIVECYENSTRPVIAKKVLAAGSISPEDAFGFVSGVRNVKGVAVGIASEEEAKETFEAASRYWPKSGPMT